MKRENNTLFLVLIGLLLLSLYSCAQKEPEHNAIEESKIGKYIYEDDIEVYHIDPHCYKLRHGTDRGGHQLHGKRPIDTADFVIEDESAFRVCVRCVDDESYNRLHAINKKNRTELAKQWLYDKLVSAYYDMPDYETYHEALSRAEIRKHLFELAIEERWNLIFSNKWGVDLNEKNFSELLGFPMN